MIFTGIRKLRNKRSHDEYIYFMLGAAAVRAASKLAEESRGTPGKNIEIKPVKKEATLSDKPSTVSEPAVKIKERKMWWMILRHLKHSGLHGYTWTDIFRIIQYPLDFISVLLGTTDGSDK